MTKELILYGVKGSPFVRKVQVVLAEKNIDFTLEPVSIFPAPDWFTEISPARRIPVLRDTSIGSEGRAGTLPDSSVICAYLERKHPEPALYPSEAFAYARALWFEEYADSELAGQIGTGMFRPLIVAGLMGKEPDVETARKTFREKLPPMFDYLESEIAGHSYLVEDRFSIADIALGCQFVNLRHTGARIDSAKWPALAAYEASLLERPSLARCLADEQKLFKPVDFDL